METENKNPIGCVIAQRLTSALTCNGIDYEKLSKLVYGEFMDITLEMQDGDWIEMPNGDVFTKTFSMKKQDRKIKLGE